jgi:hypothetical protein
MTRKDYIKIASIIKDNQCTNYNNRLNKYNLIDDLSIMFKQDNSLFDKQRFVDACE